MGAGKRKRDHGDDRDRVHDRPGNGNGSGSGRHMQQLLRGCACVGTCYSRKASCRKEVVEMGKMMASRVGIFS